jgi:hypothetical protein
VATQEIAWPTKTRELYTQLYDSTGWNDFAFRADDIVISTWAKSGTTWTQQIVSQLLFEGAEELEVAEMSPWLDLRVPPNEADMPREIRRIADFLGVRIDPANWPAILEHCSFDYMKAHSTKSVPLGGAFWDGGAETFIHKGTNGRWRDELSAADRRLYEKTARRELGQECANWLASGSRKAAFLSGVRNS